jgi:hypothetical protein
MMYAFLFSKAANLLASDLCLCSSVICIFAFSLWILFRVFQGGECCKEGTDTWVSRGEIQVRSINKTICIAITSQCCAFYFTCLVADRATCVRRKMLEY